MAKQVEHHVFYHSNAPLPKELSLIENENIKLINLDELEIPENLRLTGVSAKVNRAILAEYLGILTVNPTTRMVGTFTYSIPLKFSREWAEQTGQYNLFLPPISFSRIVKCTFSPDKLYGVEFKAPNDRDKEAMRAIQEYHYCGSLTTKGPFKGSFVVERGIFCDLQKWLLEIAEEILKWEGAILPTDKISEFGSSELAARDYEQRKLDAFRHNFGNVLERAVAYYLGNRFPGDKKMRIGEYLENTFSKDKSLEEVARQVSSDNKLVVVFGNSGYTEVVRWWINDFRALGRENYLIVCLDNEIFNSLEKEGRNLVLEEFCGSRSEFWTFRLRVIKKLIDDGFDVIHSDADAYWLDDPFYEYFSSPSADILASQGTIHPNEVARAQGFVFCCGLMYFSNTEETRLFFEEWIIRSEKVGDDQTAFNELIFEKGVEWRPKNTTKTYALECRGESFSCFEEVIYGDINRFVIGLLPHKMFQRIFEPARPYVAHLLAEKNSESKAEERKKLGEYPVKSFVYEDTREDNQEGIPQGRGKSNIIWLASYPRSGNTLLRILLKHNFGVTTNSIYNDPNDIGFYPEVASVVGHEWKDWPFAPKNIADLTPEEFNVLDSLREDAGRLHLIKTHEPWHEGYAQDRAIYIYRDGRAAVDSHASYLQSFSGSIEDKEKLVDRLIAAGAGVGGSWSENVLSWMNQPDDQILFICFEEMVQDFQGCLNKISDFLGLSVKRRDILSFNDLQQVNSDFFRKGDARSWEDSYKKSRNDLFWLLHGEAMEKLGYTYRESFIRELFPKKNEAEGCQHFSISHAYKDDNKADYKALEVSQAISLAIPHAHNVAEVGSYFVKLGLWEAYAHTSTNLAAIGGGLGVGVRRMAFLWDNFFRKIFYEEYPEKWPYIYIVTPSYNAAEYIDKTILSVLSQEGDFFIRYHIQDGGSTDGTIEKLESWKRRVEKGDFDCFSRGVVFTYSVEVDEGLYDAVNKGFSRFVKPSQAIMAYINADDVYGPGAFSLVAESMGSHANISWLVGSKKGFGEFAELRGAENFRFPREVVRRGLCDSINWPFLPQESVFWKARLWNAVGGLNGEMKYAGDWDLWRRFAENAEPVHTRHSLGVFRKRRGQLGSDVDQYQEEIRSRCKEVGLDDISIADIPDQMRCSMLSVSGNRKGRTTYALVDVNVNK